MRIALVTPDAGGKGGGVESVNLLLGGTLRAQGHELDLIAPGPATSSPGWRILEKLFGGAVRTAREFKGRTETYDLVICNGEYGLGISHPRCVNLFHGCYFGFRKYLRDKLSWRQYANLTRLAWIQALSARGKTVVAVSGFVKDLLEEQGLRVHHVVPNSIDTGRFVPREEPGAPGRYLFVGAYNRYGKGFDVLERLAESGLEIHCLTDRRPGGKLRHMDMVAQDRMHEVYPRYRMLIFPSRFEGLQMSPLEAMACGLPVVMSDVGLGPELRREIPEFVVEGWGREAADEYRSRIGLIEADYGRFSRIAREYVERHHGLSAFGRNWGRVIREVGRA